MAVVDPKTRLGIVISEHERVVECLFQYAVGPPYRTWIDCGMLHFTKSDWPVVRDHIMALGVTKNITSDGEVRRTSGSIRTKEEGDTASPSRGAETSSGAPPSPTGSEQAAGG